MPNLPVESADSRVEVFCIQFGHMTSNSLGHSIDLKIAFADTFHRVSVILDLDFLCPGK